MQYRHEIEHAPAMLAPLHIQSYIADSFFFFCFFTVPTGAVCESVLTIVDIYCIKILQYL